MNNDSYSIFRTSLQPSLYINITVPNRATKMESIPMEKYVTGGSIPENSENNLKAKLLEKPRLIPNGVIRRSLNSFGGYLPKHHSVHDLNQSLYAPFQSFESSGSSQSEKWQVLQPFESLIYPPDPSKPSFDTQPPKKNIRVNFNFSNNKIIFINNKEYYKNSNIKNTMWWTQNELNSMRHIFTNEIKNIVKMNPKMTYKQCISTVFKSYS